MHQRVLSATRISRWVVEQAAAAGDCSSGGVSADAGARTTRTASAMSGRPGPPPVMGSVASVHARALTVRLGSGALLRACSGEAPLAPNGVAIELERDAGFERLGLRPGQRAGIDTTELHLPDAGIRVRLAGAQRWEPRPWIGHVSRDDLVRRLARARALVIAEAPPGSLMPLLWASHWGVIPAEPARSAAGPATVLRRAAAAADTAGVAAAARALAGLGPGLTPSGDDFLAGVAAAWALVPGALRARPRPADLVRTAAPRASARRDRPLGAGMRVPGGAPDGGYRAARARPRLREAEARTGGDGGLSDVSVRVLRALWAGAEAGASELGRGWLAHAIRGELAEPLGWFFSVLTAESPAPHGSEGPVAACPDCAGLAASVRAVLRLGATSGADWLTGALIGIAWVLAAPGASGSRWTT
jgi:hypothetical protein